MPDTPANQCEFPPEQEPTGGVGISSGTPGAIISLSCGAVLEWVTGPCEGKRTGETALLWALAPRLGRATWSSADRYFSGYFLLAWLIRHGADIVVRQHQLRRTDLRRVCGHVSIPSEWRFLPWLHAAPDRPEATQLDFAYSQGN